MDAGFPTRARQRSFAQEIDSYTNQFTAEGELPPRNHGAGLMASSAAASMAAMPLKDRFIDEPGNASICSGQERYYGEMLYIMNLPLVSGDYQAWARQTWDGNRAP